MVTLQVEFRPYRRSFCHPFKTAYGEWKVREGILLRLRDDLGASGFGEIAPLAWFGSETWEQAWEFCHQLNREITVANIFSIPDSLPCCQFGFESALTWLKSDQITPHTFPQSWLLPAGEKALQGWQQGWQQGYCTFKWKIGVGTIDDELAIFHDLIHALPSSAKLRLDANGSLTHETSCQWLFACDSVTNLEFLEQPLAPDQWESLLDLSQRFATQIALDESVASLRDLQICYAKGWRGVFVIKPAIVGSPSRLRQFCLQNQLDIVCSSVFETEIGRRATLDIAGKLMAPDRAVGFGINQWFPVNDPLACIDPEELWNHL